MYKPYRSFIKVINNYGLYTEISRKHLKIMKDGYLISSMSLTPGDKKVAIDHTLRYLIADGHIPKVNRRNYIYELKKAK